MRLDSNDYSVHPAVIGRRIEVLADLGRVQVLCDGGLVADHERIWARHQTISDPEPRGGGEDAAPRTRRGCCARYPNPTWQIRCLEDYDTALGVDLDGGGVA